MDNDTLISILCVVIGILVGVLGISYFKGRVKADTKSKSESKTNSKSVKAKKPTIEFSKKILIATFSIAIVIVSFAMVIIYMGAVSGFGSDSSNLNTLLGGLFVEISAGTSFYFWKARRENEIKLQNEYGLQSDSNEEEVI